ncbi:unknown [Lachnospiraceae bacterium CAG:215]|nr:unknown [Lachnospiraceae bacterium CAG:215]
MIRPDLIDSSEQNQKADRNDNDQFFYGFPIEKEGAQQHHYRIRNEKTAKRLLISVELFKRYDSKRYYIRNDPLKKRDLQVSLFFQIDCGQITKKRNHRDQHFSADIETAVQYI